MRKISLLILFVAFGLSLSHAQTLTVASYNIRNANQSDSINGNGWHQRCPVITQLVSFYDFDIWGAQEVLNRQLNDLLAGLPQYTSVGVGRDDGKTKGEYAPIFYKKDKITLLKSGDFWLSEQTDHPNKGWDAALPRICSWGYFKDKKSGLKFWFFNLHMDHVGVVARSESSKLVLKKIQEMCGKEPVILTGDFNVDQTHEGYDILTASPLLTDSYERATVRYALNGTFNSFDPNLMTDSRIDHMFVSPAFDVLKYGVLTDTYRGKTNNTASIKGKDAPQEISFQQYEARTPSDHFPIMAVLKYDKKKK